MEPPQMIHLMCIHCGPASFFNSVATLNTHLSRRHGNLATFQCGCCRKHYLHKTSLIRHLTQQDGKVYEVPEARASHCLTSGDQPQPDIQVFHLLGGLDDRGDDNSAGDLSHDAPVIEEVTPPFDLKVEASLFLMRLRSSGNVTHASVKLVMDHVEKLISNVMRNACDQTSEFLKTSGVSENELTQFLNQAFNVGDPFCGLKNVEDQINYFSDKFGMAIPQEKLLSSRVENRFDREKRMFLPAQVLETFQYIPLIETLTLIVRNTFLRNLTESEKASSDGLYCSYKDGLDFKSNAFLQRFPNSVRIVLYEDDLEVVNVLGSKDGIHKLGCFYYFIQNMPPEISSLLSSIFLLALTYAEDLKKKGAFTKVLTPLQEELKILMSEEGVTVSLPEGGTYILRATIVCFCGDSLAAHAILGFLSPSAKKFCRICMIGKDEFAEDSTFVGQLRSSAMHRQHVDAVLQNPNNAKLFGVKEKSLLMEMMRVPEDSVFDVLHDLVGVICMDLKLALYEFICVRKLFSVYDFNSNINAFDYGKPDVKNKPSANILKKKLLDKGHSLKQSGSQTFCLLRIFPFIISGVEEHDRYLELIFLLQDIVKIMLSFQLKDVDLERLRTATFQHNQLFHDLFIAPPAAPPGDNEDEHDVLFDEFNDEENYDTAEEDNGGGDDELEEEIDAQEPPRRRRRFESKRLKKGINKLHHIMHASQQIQEKGPVVRLGCARFEARHRFFRKHSGVQSNFKNVPKTMARVYQLSSLSAVLSMTGPRDTIVTKTGAQSCSVTTNSYKDLLLANGFKDSDEIQIVKSAHVCGEEYSSGLFVGSKHEGVQPVFAVIMDVIIKAGGQAYLVLSKCRNKGLSSRFNAYQIDNVFDQILELVDVKELSNHRPIAVWTPCMATGDESLYLSPRTINY